MKHKGQTLWDRIYSVDSSQCNHLIEEFLLGSKTLKKFSKESGQGLMGRGSKMSRTIYKKHTRRLES